MSAGEWALVAVLFWMGGTMMVGALVGWVVLRKLIPPAIPAPPADARLRPPAPPGTPASLRAVSALQGRWEPPDGA